jgi:hypothetical protein
MIGRTHGARKLTNPAKNAVPMYKIFIVAS